MLSILQITRVVIAHRPALVEKADIVLRMEGGRLVLERDRRRDLVAIFTPDRGSSRRVSSSRSRCWTGP